MTSSTLDKAGEVLAQYPFAMGEAVKNAEKNTVAAPVEDAGRAVGLVESLSGRKEFKDLLQRAHGLQFVFTKKGGVGIGVTRAQGFTIAKLHNNDDGTAQWSAPCFLSSTSLSLGAIVGVHGAESLSFLMSEKAITFTKDNGFVPLVGGQANLTLAIGVVTNAGVNALSGDESKDVITMNTAKGALLDLSFDIGELSVDEPRNLATYGGDLSPGSPSLPRSILGDSHVVPPPQGFDALYTKLNAVATA